MLLSLSLRAKLAFIFLAMLSMILICGVGMVWNTHLVNTMLVEVIQKDLILYETAREMELALAKQKGYLTYFFVDGDNKWLNSLTTFQQVFRQNLNTALALDLNEEQNTMLVQIDQTYNEYQGAKDEAIRQYRADSNPDIISGSH